jgi:type VI secretion system secreted protein VgrG
MEHFAELDSPFGPDLLLGQLTASESLSEPFTYSVLALSPKPDLKFDDLLGQHITVRLHQNSALSGEPRYFDSLVEQVSLVGQSGRFFQYLIIARPWFWFLSQTQDCKVFQNQTVLEIIETVLGDHPIASIDDRTTTAFTPWVYCVQYRESDFNFLSRLMEQEGIYYFFEHSAGKHTLVLADAVSASEPCPGCSPLKVRYQHGGQAGGLGEEACWDLVCTQRVQPGSAVIQDYDFTRTQTDLSQTRSQPGNHTLGNMEVFDYPGFYDLEGDGEQFVRAQMEEYAAVTRQASAQSDARALATGGLVKLEGSLRESDNCEYLVTGTQITVSQTAYESAGQAAGSGFSCRFTALDSSVPYRAPRKSPKPVVQGPQTAVVVGPAGDEIFTDKYGRVKVQFHWDRYGKKNEKSSCWVRVSSPWAGKSFGFIQVPRIGQEVVVDFLEGDPDQPLITGRVYNAENMPPWELPANMTQSGVLTRSTKGGSYDKANALRFEDKKGQEQVWLHAEKNQDIEVENDETHWVGHDRKKTVDNNETNHIKVDRTETVDNNETITIGVDRKESVGNNETIDIGVNRTETVGANEDITIGANRTVTVGASESITVGASQSVTVGASRTDTIAASLTQTIGAAAMVNIGAGLTQIVGGPTTMVSGGPFTIMAPAGMTIVAPGGTNIIDMQLFQTGGTVSEAYALKMDYNLLVTEVNGVKIEATVSSNAAVAVKFEKVGAELGGTDAVAKLVALEALSHATSIDMSTLKVLF